VHPGDLKAAVGDYINRLLAPIRQEWTGNPELEALARDAYPDPSKAAGKAIFLNNFKIENLL